MKVSQLTLEELFSKPKITPSIEKAIIVLSDFSAINEAYCSNICKLKCKTPESVTLLNQEVDILFIQDHRPLPGKYDRRPTQQQDVEKAVIDFIARKAGLQGLTYRITSLLKCSLEKDDLVKGKAPTATKLLKCKPYLLEEIRKVNPKVIVSLGTAASKALGFKQIGNGRDRGKIITLAEGDLKDSLPDIPVVVTAHPRILSMIRQNAQGAGMWGSDYFDVIQRDFKKAGDLARGEVTIQNVKEAVAFYRENRITFCKTVDEVNAALAILEKLDPCSVVSFDTETTGLDPLSPLAKLLTIQFGYRDPSDGVIKAIVIPLWHRRNKSYDPILVWPRIAAFLEGPTPKVAHHGKFDILYIYWTTGTRVRNLKFDTMLLLHSISSGNQGCYGLKAATWDYLYDLGFAGYEDLLPKLKSIGIDLDEDETELEGNKETEHA